MWRARTSVISVVVAQMGCSATDSPSTAAITTPSSTPTASAAPNLVGGAPGSSSAVVATSSSSAPVSPAPPKKPCPDDMVDVGVACIDRFEAPNIEGARPLLMQSSSEGAAYCEERSKHLCNEEEWVRACEGPSKRNFPYGPKYEEHRCNDDGKFIAARWSALASWPGEEARTEVKRLDQSEPSGTRKGCVTEEGVFDLTGNVAEWVVRTRDNPTNHGHVVRGCFWGKCFRPPHTPSCDYVNYAHPSGFRSYELGFRCCKART